MGFAPLYPTTRLAPEIVEAILDGRQPAHLTVNDLMEPFPVEWEEQKRHFFRRAQDG